MIRFHTHKGRIVNSASVSRVPKCPACVAPVEYTRIRIDKPFPCPSCGRQLMVPSPYTKRILYFSMALGIALVVLVTCGPWASAPRTDSALWRVFLRGILLYGLTAVVATFLGGIFAKRIFPPELEDCEEYSKQAHYTAL